MVYVVANQLITTLITGTGTGDTLMQTLLPQYTGALLE